MSIVVTGGAGFIGSCIVRTLNDMDHNDIIIVDNIANTEKWLNIRNKKYTEYIHKNVFLERLPSIKNITHIIHMGACSATTEKNFDYLYNNNFEFTKTLWNYCKNNNASFIYASSAATYGDGNIGFNDEIDINKLLPLNGYGYSKQLFDLFVQKQTDFPIQHVGLKFFNVYGPNEYFKGSMASVILHGFNQIKESGKIKLFKSYNSNYANGGQLRDFVYVKDVCDVIKYFFENPNISGLFNVGTGCAESFKTLSESIFNALNIPVNIEYIDMPQHLIKKYQYFTQASVAKLRNVGYTTKFHSLCDGTTDYVKNYLEKDYLIY